MKVKGDGKSCHDNAFLEQIQTITLDVDLTSG
ncbi:hypothetical protein JOC27_000602 [Sporolactobacillus spathodeae]|uniref:Transposase n=1 Tax=Sporolactobacillus spathodeae TaxID=1465502 RepID=A0ABS2Q6F3_9BACL|nr:hypothetical protein [Sporolactobacillus spathodeae]